MDETNETTPTETTNPQVIPVDFAAKAAELAPETTPAAEPGTVEEPAPVKPPQTLKLSNKATVVTKDGDAEAVTTTVWRNAAAVLRHMLEKKGTPTMTVRITVGVDETSELKTDAEGNPLEVVMAEGNYGDVVQELLSRAIPAPSALREFQQLSAFMADRSDLKGVIVTAVFGDGEAAGFGMLTTTNEITNTDMIVLGEAAVNQAKSYMDAVKKQHPDIHFPSDPSEAKLILPDRFK